jgi:type VI secretion system protein ImpI
MNAMTVPSLNLMVTNVQLLESGLTPKSNWTPEGGTIGSSFSDDWRLRDKFGLVRSSHCEIVVIDGAYCLRDCSGETYINGSFMPMGRNKLAKLEHQDEIKVGPYLIRVSMGNLQDNEKSAAALDQIFDFGQQGLLAHGNEFDDLDASEPEISVADPLLALEEMIQRDIAEESLIDVPLEQDKGQVNNDSLFPPLKNKHAVSLSQQADGEHEMTSSIRLKRILGFGSKKAEAQVETPKEPKSLLPNNNNDQYSVNNQSEGYGMDENVLDLLEEEVAKSMTSQTKSVTTQATRPTQADSHQPTLDDPMLSGLGVDLSSGRSAQQMQELSEELSQSLQACMKGVLELQQQIANGQFAANRSMQPIEDNALRLGLPYDETMHTLFDPNRSMFHLSAPAAIADSMKSFMDHNEAIQHATSEALAQILAAFSPQVLLRRFNNYKRPTQGSDDSWAWNMYCSYYKELTSNRQKGFEKLFWDIFGQAYDKKIREKQLEF